ncbi:MAG: GNAT family N-acetyltransferase [Dehalococcoidia bacterium]
MTTTIDPVRLTEPQLPEASEVLSRAFFDDPMMMYLLPSDAQRGDVLPWFMGSAARYTHLFGEVYTTPANVEGNACWLPPGETDLSEERMAQVGFMEAPERMGGESFGRFIELMGRLGELHHAAVPPEHWYLLVLGVDPPRQGQGVGAALIQPILARADADQVPCYLETMKTRNVPFYRKHGFEVVVEDDTPDGGLHYWTMRRDPLTSKR